MRVIKVEKSSVQTCKIISSLVMLCLIISINQSLIGSQNQEQSNDSNIDFFQGRSLFTLAAAPEPAPASARSAARMPPINGSIFGKRSVNNLVARGRNRSSPTESPVDDQRSSADRYTSIITDVIEDFLAKNDKGEYLAKSKSLKIVPFSSNKYYSLISTWRLACPQNGIQSLLRSYTTSSRYCISSMQTRI